MQLEKDAAVCMPVGELHPADGEDGGAHVEWGLIEASHSVAGGAFPFVDPQWSVVSQVDTRGV
ncbi:hypothetical protein MARA_02950 (plasmid) [Mycolicibacterium arabiense]|uniref:Uncharacterized protein n=1 Tax=Mycolicibacterium arabiense TaxID=1286181 RepID=A0A7I7RSV6_9MYCO|nr:hypothetical protein MARA_02950 [Mycolicibacterium arabiense]